MIPVELSEWSELGPASETRLRSYRITDARARLQAEELTKRGVLELTALESGLSVRSFSFVGRVELGDLAVTVRPKVAPSTLLTLMRFAYSLQDLRLFDAASFDVGCDGLQDLLIAQLEAEARALVQGGALRRYVRWSEALASPRGRIDLPRLAQSRPGNVASIPCIHHPRSSDFVLNQVVRAGLEFSRGMTRQLALRRSLASTAALYAEMASLIRIDRQALDTAERSLDRLSSAYESILRLVRILYESSHLALEEGSLRINGFMFDMNRFFQNLVGKFLTQSLSDYRVTTEQTIRHMLAYASGYNPRGRRSPSPRPDFVVASPCGQAYLLDAKYRDLWRTELPREMLYQLAIYALIQPAGSTAAILYPTEDSAATEAIVNIRDPMSAAPRARVALRPFVIPRIAPLLDEQHSKAGERRECAEALVLGSPLQVG